MKTLIIHPKDTSTVFLEPIYEKIDNETIIQKNYSKQEIVDLIMEDLRIKAISIEIDKMNIFEEVRSCAICLEKTRDN